MQQFILVVLYFGLTHANIPTYWKKPCGAVDIDPRTTLCCEGLAYIRSGIQPACCGVIGYDARHYLCCERSIVRKSLLIRNPACCGKNVFDKFHETCSIEGYVEKKTDFGSECCLTEAGWKCCSKSEGCCNRAGVGVRKLTVPGFKPACCGFDSTVLTAECCAEYSEKVGAVPQCCASDDVRPICCNKPDGSWQCCAITYGYCCGIEKYKYRLKPTPPGGNTGYGGRGPRPGHDHGPRPGIEDGRGSPGRLPQYIPPGRQPPGNYPDVNPGYNQPPHPRREAYPVPTPTARPPASGNCCSSRRPRPQCCPSARASNSCCNSRRPRPQCCPTARRRAPACCSSRNRPSCCSSRRVPTTCCVPQNVTSSRNARSRDQEIGQTQGNRQHQQQHGGYQPSYPSREQHGGYQPSYPSREQPRYESNHPSYRQPSYETNYDRRKDNRYEPVYTSPSTVHITTTTTPRPQTPGYPSLRESYSCCRAVSRYRCCREGVQQYGRVFDCCEDFARGHETGLQGGRQPHYGEEDGNTPSSGEETQGITPPSPDRVPDYRPDRDSQPSYAQPSPPFPPPPPQQPQGQPDYVPPDYPSFYNLPPYDEENGGNQYDRYYRYYSYDGEDDREPSGRIQYSNEPVFYPEEYKNEGLTAKENGLYSKQNQSRGEGLNPSPGARQGGEERERTLDRRLDRHRGGKNASYDRIGRPQQGPAGPDRRGDLGPPIVYRSTTEKSLRDQEATTTTVTNIPSSTTSQPDYVYEVYNWDRYYDTGKQDEETPSRGNKENQPTDGNRTYYYAEPAFEYQPDKCNNEYYDMAVFICCDDVLRYRIGRVPTCCGNQAFDAAEYKCCNGKIQRSCDANYTPVKTAWGKYI